MTHMEGVSHALEVTFTQPLVYETTIVAASLVTFLAGYYGWLTWGKPWWEANKMRKDQEEQEKRDIGNEVFWTFKNMVKDGKLSVDRAEVWLRRFAIPNPHVLPNGIKNLKQELQEKQEEREHKEEPKKIVSLLERLSAAKRAAV